MTAVMPRSTADEEAEDEQDRRRQLDRRREIGREFRRQQRHAILLFEERDRRAPAQQLGLP